MVDLPIIVMFHSFPIVDTENHPIIFLCSPSVTKRDKMAIENTLRDGIPSGKLLQFATLKPLLPSRHSWNLPSYKMVNLSIVMLVYQRVFQWYSQSIVGECSKNMVDLSIVFCIYTHRQWIKMVVFHTHVNVYQRVRGYPHWIYPSKMVDLSMGISLVEWKPRTRCHVPRRQWHMFGKRGNRTVQLCNCYNLPSLTMNWCDFWIGQSEFHVIWNTKYR